MNPIQQQKRRFEFPRMVIRWVAPLILASVVCAQSDSTVPPAVKSQLAITAKVKCDKALKDAQDAYIKAQQAAYAEYITALDNARMVAFKNENATEVEALSKEKIRVQEEQKGLEQAPALVQARSVTGKVPANQHWTKVTEVKKGQVLEITAEGTWRHDQNHVCDPDGVKGAEALWGRIPVGTLTGKVGDSGRVFVVGKSVTYMVENDGPLLLGSHGNNPAGRSGELKVTVNVKAPRR